MYHTAYITKHYLRSNTLNIGKRAMREAAMSSRSTIEISIIGETPAAFTGRLQSTGVVVGLSSLYSTLRLQAGDFVQFITGSQYDIIITKIERSRDIDLVYI